MWFIFVNWLKTPWSNVYRLKKYPLFDVPSIVVGKKITADNENLIVKHFIPTNWFLKILVLFLFHHNWFYSNNIITIHSYLFLLCWTSLSGHTYVPKWPFSVHVTVKPYLTNIQDSVATIHIFVFQFIQKLKISTRWCTRSRTGQNCNTANDY